jgi:predicted SprT family Zn-dependent metalloprotease
MPKKKIQSVEEDPQREILYNMEFSELRGHWRGTKTKLKTLHRYVRLVCRLYGLQRPTLFCRRIKGGGQAVYWSEHNSIQLDPTWGRVPVVLAHELAHHVTFNKSAKVVQDHGPRFVRVYAEVLHIMRLMPMQGMKAICRKHGVKMARSAA